MKITRIISFLLPSAIGIAILDYYVFGSVVWHDYLLACVIEIFILIIGFNLGYFYKNEEVQYESNKTI